MLQELAYEASGRQQPAPTQVDLQQFLRLYLNHRPALQEPSDEVSQAFAALGADSATGMWVMQWLFPCNLMSVYRKQGLHSMHSAENGNSHAVI